MEQPVSKPMIFGVGAAKTGTHSLARMFEDNFRAAHEPAAEPIMRLILARSAGRLSQRDFTERLAACLGRDALDLNSSQINGAIVQDVYGLYPCAHYVLTIRDPASWLRSFMNHQITRPLTADSAWQAFRDWRFRPSDHPPTPADEPLIRRGLYGLDAYLSYWLRHNAQVIATVDPERLFIVPTDDLPNSAADLSAFLGVDQTAIRTDKAHDFVGQYVESPADALDPAYLKGAVETYAARLEPLAGGRLPARSIAALRKAITVPAA